MPEITIVKRFILNDDDHKLTEYLPGRYDVTDAVANHWYVKAHMEGFQDPPPKVGTEQQATLLAAQAARLNEPVEDQGQQPAKTVGTTKAETRFAGRKVPPQTDPGMVSFIDPAKK